jgi:hypothetical protein
MVSAQGCIGVLSAEVAAGCENDPSMRATIALFAAQLSAIVAAWPEPSGLVDDAASRTDTIAVTL